MRERILDCLKKFNRIYEANDLFECLSELKKERDVIAKLIEDIESGKPIDEFSDKEIREYYERLLGREYKRNNIIKKASEDLKIRLRMCVQVFEDQEEILRKL